MNADTPLAGLQWTVAHAFEGSPFYRKRLQEAGCAPQDIASLDDLQRLPFTDVTDLRDGYPLPLLSVPESEVVRIHASSGTTGKRKILAYTRKDVDDWADMMARCMSVAGVTRKDRVQICVGYGLWTAGVGFQLGCERLGAMAVPVGPGLMDIQLQLLEDVRPSTVCSTASMALLLAEEVERRGLRERIGLKRVIFGAEAHSVPMRRRFESLLGLEHSFDISGMTELYGPGAGIECPAHNGIHYWSDYFILEILDPATLQPVAPGEVGEMVVTTLRKEGTPLIRYRTHDLTRILPDNGPCACGCCYPRHDRILGRSDDMFIVRGVNIYPGQIAEILASFPELGSEYQIALTRHDGRDHMRITVETAQDTAPVPGLDGRVADELHRRLLVRGEVALLPPGGLPRTFAKTKRVLDERESR